MRSDQLPFHPSFERTRRTDEGHLMSSDRFPDIVIRDSTYIDPNEDRMFLVRSGNEQIKLLETLGIQTVNPRPIITETGIALVVDRVQGNTLEEEIESGNTEATTEYGRTLVKLTQYYKGSIEEPGTAVLGDIVASCQFTWQNNEAVLHDISTVKMDKLSFVLLNSCHIAYELARHHKSFDEATITEITKGLGEISKSLDDSQDIDRKSKLFLSLTLALVESSRSDTLQLLADAYDADVFEN